MRLSKESGIKILLDLPINHTSDQHSWFKSSVQSESNYSDYYIWTSNLPTEYGLPWNESSPPESVWHTRKGRKGYFYGLFGYANPDLNFHNENVVNEIKYVLAHWLNKGVDGFRLDAARYFVEEGPKRQADTKSNLEFINEIVSYAKDIAPNTYFIGETYTNMESSKQYIEGENSFDAIFNFEFSSSLRDLYNAQGLKDYHQSENGLDVLKTSIFDLYSRISRNIAASKDSVVFLNSHDTRRFDSTETALVANNILASLTILSPFNSMVYYGEEVGLSQVESWEHEYSRGLMRWNSTLNFGFNAEEI